MAASIQLEVVTPERLVEAVGVESLVLPGADGFIGVLKDHAPMVARLKAGPLRVRVDGKVRRFAVSGGFFEVAGNRAIVLADAAERAEEIDIERARAARDRALARLRTRGEDVDYVRARVALERALVRLKTAGSADFR